MNLGFALNPAAGQTPAAPAQSPGAPASGAQAAPAQFPAAGPAPPAVQQGQVAAPMVQSLKVIVLQGDRAINDIGTRIGVQPVIEVRDDNDRPVEGANVIFRLPPNGPGGTFDGKSLSKSARTNVQGQAGVTGFAPNSEVGRFDIHVTAISGNRMGEAVIPESNSERRFVLAPPPIRKAPWWRNKYVIVGGAAVVAAGIALAVVHSGSGKSVTITPGTATIGQ